MSGLLNDELDASVEFGSGYLCIVGPPSSGKTTLALRYLVDRERAFARSTGVPAAISPAPGAAATASAAVPPRKSGERRFLMEYWTARSFGGDALAQMAHRVEQDTAATSAANSNSGASSPRSRRRRLAYDCTPLEFGYYVSQWLEAQAPGSELHLVVDDADTLEMETATVDTWLSNCLNTKAAAGKKVCLWLISQLPLRLTNCFRFHFVSPLTVEAVAAWLREEQRIHGPLLSMEEEAARLQMGGSGTVTAHHPVEDQEVVPLEGTSRHEHLVSPTTVSECVAQAVQYYATHQPMCASVVCKDVRLLLRRVYQLLPALVALGGELGAGENDAPKPIRQVRLNALHYSTAWGKYKELGADSRKEDAAAATDPLVVALKKIGYSAVLLAFAAFYCGAVPRRKQLEVFDTGTRADQRGASKADSHPQSHKAAVLSAASQVIALPRLLHIYEALVKMCIAHIDPCEFASSDVAAHYLHGFHAWGLLTPVVSQKGRKKYHCWIPVSTAVALGRVLAINLFDLIPS